jgi:hypothetical protein
MKSDSDTVRKAMAWGVIAAVAIVFHNIVITIYQTLSL